MGVAGERLGRWYLEGKGLRVVVSNVESSSGELDLIAMDGPTRVAIEVRARTGPGDPIDAIGAAKRRKVASLARGQGATRVDFLAIRLGEAWVDFHWLPGTS